ncbi:hypothetical protein LX16_0193 [Stackebrandtia albiflava]|uniref:Methylamine utilization protein MauE n=1 Tax=Stackebrandtia albiflava TaxID=406432 RepID=A0A562V9J3_9ACTN|nr:hypothetical protein [Stackebrandtia albiflava]TWJ14508.1 hypothetical protein LX16_0193 [Stackebrandtia albiflava]
MIGWIVMSAAAAVLAAAAILKAVDAAANRLEWPTGPVLLRWRIPVGLAVTGEVLAAVAVVVAPGRWTAAAVLAGAYGVLALAAHTLRGSQCACFGALGGRVTTWHVAADVAVIPVVAAAAALAGPAPAIPLRAGMVAVITAAVAGTVTVLSRRRRRIVRDSTSDCLRHAHHVRVLTLKGCSGCEALLTLRGGRGGAVVWHQVTGDDDPYARDADGQFPCAIVVDDEGRALCPPVWGLADIDDLLDRQTALALDGAG